MKKDFQTRQIQMIINGIATSAEIQIGAKTQSHPQVIKPTNLRMAKKTVTITKRILITFIFIKNINSS